MTLNYKLDKDDFLTYQLYVASKSKRIQKKKMRGWVLLLAGSLLLVLYFYFINVKSIVVYFSIVAVAIGIFYKKYFNWRYKRHYKKHIDENYSNRIDINSEVEITDTHILTRDKISEGKIIIDEVKEVINIPNYLFIVFSTDVSLIIPKQKLNNFVELELLFKNKGIQINNDLDWKWE